MDTELMDQMLDLEVMALRKAIAAALAELEDATPNLEYVIDTLRVAIGLGQPTEHDRS